MHRHISRRYVRSGHTLHQGNRLARLSCQIEAASLVGYVKRRQYRNIYITALAHGSVPVRVCAVDIAQGLIRNTIHPP